MNDSPTTLDTEETAFVEAFIARLRVAHHIPGRLRLKLAGGPGLPSVPLSDIRHFQAALETTRGIHAVELNPLARSCTVRYDASLHLPQAWDDLVAGRITEVSGPLARLLEARYRETQSTRSA